MIAKRLATVVLLLTLLCSCTMFSAQTELDPRLTEPTKLEDIPFLTIEKMGFIEGGKICAERNGIPAWMHPLVVQVFGCASMEFLKGKVVSCDVIYTVDWILEHELNHCRGYID